MRSFWTDVRVYVGRMREFERADWLVYLVWVGLMVAVVAASAVFLSYGRLRGAVFPTTAWLVPAGAAVFTFAIAVDTIGHRTVYKQALAGGEALVHHVIIGLGIASCVLLCLGWRWRSAVTIPAAVATGLSFLYSLVDEAMHWRRYLAGHSDRVEMWSHVFILAGHSTMMLGWWAWYLGGYAGVAEVVG